MLLPLIKTLRLRQWPKNVFVLAAVVFDRQLLNPDAIIKSLAGMLLFCLLSSSVYIINDILDAEADRNHPQKRNRPIASGKLPIPVAAITAALLLMFTLPLAFFLSSLFGWIALIYFLVNLAYSTRLKHIPLIDVLIIAAGFVLRVAGGVSLIVVERFSPWLYVVTTLFALYIGFGKRRAELTLLAQDANNHRRVLEGYTLTLLDQLITIVSSTTIVAYSLYTFSAPNLPDNHTMMLTIPFVIYGIFRYLYLIQVEKAGGAPEDILLSDRPLQITVALWGMSVLFVFYLN
ncbi:MAG: decaprenyl-phosphate phosphoribosyltransferase [Chloroflexota bacterium]|jgi:4-hydroxybenzoate polyprenyltransferase